jgi:cellulose synthase/poly-beta-1,6-N-acetylglucosamine synthase-like glycosyltransferase
LGCDSPAFGTIHGIRLDYKSAAPARFIKLVECLMQYPLVSAIVLCYNQARFVVECLEAVKAQNYPNLELIINDDASKDDSVAVIEGWLAQNNIPYHFFKNQTNQGICHSVNKMLRQARGKYISGIAADDVWLPGKLRTQVEILEGLPGKVGVVYSDALQMDESGKILPERFIGSHRRFETMPAGDIHNIMWEGNFIPAMTTLIRRDCFEKVGLYDETLFYEDWDMWLRLSHSYDFAFSDEVSAKYRIVGTSMIRSQWARMLDAMCQICEKHLRQGALDPVARRQALSQLRARATCSFDEITPRYKQNLRWALRHSPSAGVYARCLFVWSGLGPKSFERVRAVLCKTKFPGDRGGKIQDE